MKVEFDGSGLHADISGINDAGEDRILGKLQHNSSALIAFFALIFSIISLCGFSVIAFYEAWITEFLSDMLLLYVMIDFSFALAAVFFTILAFALMFNKKTGISSYVKTIGIVCAAFSSVISIISIVGLLWKFIL